MTSDLSIFLRQVLRNPSQISAVAPSSERLARKMVAALPDSAGPIVELGPGTGKFTRALLAAGVAPHDLAAFEMSQDFVSHLRQRFPLVDVRHRGAQHMDEAFGTTPLRAVVSGLPLLSIPLQIQRAILSAAFRRLAPGAPFIQFTYGPFPPVPQALRDELGLSARSTGWVMANLPPAQVYLFTRNPH